MNDIAANELMQALSDRRPVVLFLGQDAWSSTQQPDPILSALLTRIERAGDINLGWPAVFKNSSITADDMNWITERFQRNVQPEGMQDILNIAWSAIFTTSIDPTLARRIETHGRQPEAVLAKDHFARVPRSRSRPPVYYLFGRSSETQSDMRSPTSRLELRQRISTHANNMLNRIAETVTPLGILVVDGYTPNCDWLDIDDFLAPLSTADGLQILWFGAYPDIQSEFFAELVKKGILLPCARRLVEVVADLEARGLLEPVQSLQPDGPSVISLDGEKFINVPPSLRLRVEASAAIVDDTWTEDVLPLDGLEAEEEFRRFHGDLGGPRNLVEGVGRGYAIKRDFEDGLRSQVEALLRDQGNVSQIVILHGQSGTGKSVAMARLAYDLRKQNWLPVLYASGRIPQATDLEEFCETAEQNGAPGSIILCDTNQSLNRYLDLSNALRSRGRRVVVVGTSYRMETKPSSGTFDLIEAPAEISASERASLISLVRKFATDSSLLQSDAITSEYALPLLYRILSASRERIISGVSAEARMAEKEIRERARSIPIVKLRSALAEQLIAAGLHGEAISLFDENREGAELGADAPGRLIDYVMAVGRLNCPVPVNLLIRALRARKGSIDLMQIGYLFRELDIFRWRMSDSEGNDLLIAPRLQLEAELICRRRLADFDRELECIVDLIEGVRISDIDNSAEIHFVLDLLQKLDKDGPRKDIYRNGYLRIAEALTTLRTHHHVIDASLMLQESAFRRAALLWLNHSDGEVGDLHEEKRYQILNEARDVVEQAIKNISDGKLRAGRRTKENLHVERASIYGFLAVGRAKAKVSPDEVWSDYIAARTAIGHAMAISDNYFPLDVGLWTPVDILDCNVLSPARSAEMKVDIYSMLDQVNPDLLPPLQQQNYQRRRVKVARTLGDVEMSEEAYKNLEVINPPVAYYLRARGMCLEIFDDNGEPFSVDVRNKARIAADFLYEHNEVISSDIRCLHLLLQLKWSAATGDRLLHGERQAIPHDKDVRTALYSAVSELNLASTGSARSKFRFLEATLEWLVGDKIHARELWRTLSHDTEYEDASRVIRRLYVAEADGKPMMYRGRLEKERSEGHWWINIEGVTGRVDLLARDFRNENLQPGRELKNLAIAFNYLGPIVDPASRYGSRL